MDYVQSGKIYEVACQIVPPLVSRFGTCLASFLGISAQYATAEGILALVFHSIVLLTAAKTWRLHRQWRAVSSGWQTSLAAVLLHDAITFCCCIGVLVVVNVYLRLMANVRRVKMLIRR